MTREFESIEHRLKSEAPDLIAIGEPSADRLIARYRQRKTQRRVVVAAIMAAFVATTVAYRVRPASSNGVDVNGLVVADTSAHDGQDSEPVITSESDVASEPAPRWVVSFGEVDEDDRVPVFVADPKEPQKSVPIGYVAVPQIREVPVWRLPVDTQDEIYANWDEAGYHQMVTF